MESLPLKSQVKVKENRIKAWHFCRFKNAIFLAVVAALSLVTACDGKTPVRPSSSVLVGRVVKVSDGDTITILTGGSQLVATAPGGTRPVASETYKIRLHGIDAPEKKQAFGNASRKFLAGLVANREVRVAWSKRDRYQRILGTVFVDGKDANLEMLKAGMAWHYKKYDSTPAYAQAESEARAAKRGLWQEKNPIEPEQFRHASEGKPKEHALTDMSEMMRKYEITEEEAKRGLIIDPIWPPPKKDGKDRHSKKGSK